jgi:hypothetical protein
MRTNEAKKKTSLSDLQAKKMISGICERSSEWEGIKTPDQEKSTLDSNCSGQLCTPDTQ